MFFARAGFVFKDNAVGGSAIGSSCSAFAAHPQTYDDPTIADLLSAAGVSWAVYAEGYDVMKAAVAADECPAADAGCPLPIPLYPCTYDPTDIPFQYYPTLMDDPAHMRDLTDLHAAITAGTLPAVSWVKLLGYKTEHPGYSITVSAGADAVAALVDDLLTGPQGADTLVFVTFDEGGGFYDHHVPPPAANAADGEPYGVRVPTLALGPFVAPGTIAHTTLEHSSTVKFIEWNWLGGVTGQLGTRDANVANIGALLDATKTGVAVPAD